MSLDAELTAQRVEALAPSRRSTTSSFLAADQRGLARGSSLSPSFTVTSAMLALLYPVSNDPGCDGRLSK